MNDDERAEGMAKDAEVAQAAVVELHAMIAKKKSADQSELAALREELEAVKANGRHWYKTLGAAIDAMTLVAGQRDVTKQRLAIADELIREAWRVMDGQDAKTAEWHVAASHYINNPIKPDPVTP